jgi:hypothetical protein
MLQDPFGKEEAPQRTVWYQSKYFRANLHFRENQFYLRDLHVYNDRYPQPYLMDPARQHGIEQRMLAVLDGYHWSDDEVRAGHSGVRAMGRFVLIGEDGRNTPLEMSGLPAASEAGSILQTSVPLSSGAEFVCTFREREIAFSLIGAPSHTRLGLTFEWVSQRSALRAVSPDRLNYRFRNFDYNVDIVNGIASKSSDGVNIIADKHHALRILMAQIS